MKNKEVAGKFYELADILEIKGVDWKPRAFRNAARNIENLNEDVVEIYKNKGVKGLKEISGVGDAIADKIEEFIKTGKIESLDRERKSIPKGLYELMEVQGLGPKKIYFLHKNLKIDNLEKLREAAKENKIRGLKGFGEKTEENILKSLEIHDKASEIMLLGYALPIAEELKERLSKIKEVQNVKIAGSLARRKETIGDLDILVASKNPEKVMDFFTKMSDVSSVISKGKTKSSIVLNSGLQVDLRVIDEDEFGSATQYFVGSVAHNVKMRQIAISKGMKLSEYGVFKGEKKVAGKDEKEVYKVLGVEWMPYELREDLGEIEAGIKGKIPKIIELEDVRADFQMHTNYSDGSATIKEMAEACKKMGYESVTITDHYGSLKVARAMDEKRINEQFKEIEKVEKELGIKIFKGAEININKDGSLDCEESVLKNVEVVVASIHSSFSMNKEEATKRVINAINNKHVNIIGHISGRLIGRREGLDLDYDKIIEAAKQNDVVLEINGQPDRLDIRDIYAKKAIEQGVKISLGTDAHSINGLGNMKLAVYQARRAWAQKKDILNCWDVKKIERLFR